MQATRINQEHDIVVGKWSFDILLPYTIDLLMGSKQPSNQNLYMTSHSPEDIMLAYDKLLLQIPWLKEYFDEDNAFMYMNDEQYQKISEWIYLDDLIIETNLNHTIWHITSPHELYLRLIAIVIPGFKWQYSDKHIIKQIVINGNNI